VLCTDPFVTAPRLLPLDQVVENAVVLVIGAPHRDYLSLATDKPVVDVWNLLGNGTMV
jgi:UDP-N-acetyl-D-mannosaminuronic acid dehydrogenase